MKIIDNRMSGMIKGGKMKIMLRIFSLATIFSLASCDDGPIEKVTNATTGGKVVKIEGTITGLGTWSDRYDVAVAGFTEEAGNETMPYATISKVMTVDDNNHASIVLSNIGSSVTSVEVCALNRLRQRIVTFASKDISSEPEGDTIRYDFGTLDASMLAGVQTGIFNTTCTACHGDNGHAAASLNLTEGNSYAALVNQPSAKQPELSRVKPGNADSSLVWRVIYDDISAGWHQNHSDMLNKERAAGLIQLLQDWINDGAKN